MKQNRQKEEIQRWFMEICPQAVSSIRDLIGDPSTPVPSKVQLISMVLDRALGKPETPLTVTSSQEIMSEAEERLMEIVHEIQAEEEGLSDTETAAQDSEEKEEEADA